MALDLSPFADAGLDRATLEALMGEHDHQVRPGLERLWSYYRNPQTPAAPAWAAPAGRSTMGEVQGRSYRLAQERGLPARLTNPPAGTGASRETVIENDIAWRIDALVDMAFGRPVRIESTAADEPTRTLANAALDAAWSAAGGQPFLQDMALLGMVHGFVDLVLRADIADLRSRAAASDDIESVRAAASALRIELVEAPRALPVLSQSDYRTLTAYIIRTPRRERGNPADPAAESLIDRVLRRVRPTDAPLARSAALAETIEIMSAGHRRVFAGERRVVDEPNPLGVLPVVHIQNASQPFRYEGLSDVEPLIPLQDELNTRLSDRAHRVTLQSFNMYLAKGLDGLAASPIGGSSLRVAPGQVWLTDNPDAEIKAFGGDGQSPSEDRHIDELREALDKTSAVSPVVIGVIRERLGHLSSENALRITLMGVLSKTARRRLSYGEGLERMSRLVLSALDTAGILRTSESQRGIRVVWPDPLATDERTRLSAALMKRDLGVPAEKILKELGYA
jgi:hypothetical protein